MGCLCWLLLRMNGSAISNYTSTTEANWYVYHLDLGWEWSSPHLSVTNNHWSFEPGFGIRDNRFQVRIPSCINIATFPLENKWTCEPVCSSVKCGWSFSSVYLGYLTEWWKHCKQKWILTWMVKFHLKGNPEVLRIPKQSGWHMIGRLFMLVPYPYAFNV